MKKDAAPFSFPPPASGVGKNVYLARSLFGARPRYILRQTCRDEETGHYFHRDLFDLGEDPRQFILYPEDNGYFVDERLTDAIKPFAAGDAEQTVADLLWPFVRKDVRDRLKLFHERGREQKITELSPDELAAIEREIHIFDRRRLHYLWYGAIDQSRLHRMPARLCRRLLGRSRDEKEQYFIAREQDFYADEIKQYLYAVFNLQQHFNESYARVMPQGLSVEKLDACFLDAVCRLNLDPAFLEGLAPVPGLQPYLIRYVILFFDYDFGASEALNEYIRQFINSHRTFRFPQKSGTVSLDAASEIFGEPKEKLQKLDKKELTRLYRKKAKKLHPDIGGEHDTFVRLTEAFKELLRRR